MQQVLAVKDPSLFRNSPLILKVKDSLVGLSDTEELESFGEMMKNRECKDVQSVSRELAEGIRIANLGVTVAVKLKWNGQDFAVFSERPNGRLAHICGYMPAGEGVFQAAFREFTEEFIVLRGEEFLGRCSMNFPIRELKMNSTDAWSYAFVDLFEEPEVAPWIAPVQRDLGWDALPQASALDELGWEFGSIYVDPFSSSAQVCFYVEVDLPSLESLSLYHAEDKLVDTPDGARLHSLLDKPFVLIPLVDGKLASQAYNLLDSKLVPFDLSGRDFHVGMSPANKLGVCLQERVSVTSVLS